MTKQLIAILLLLCLPAAALLAQKDQDPAELSDKQAAQFVELMKRVDTQMQAAFAKDPKLKSTLETELRAIEKIADEKMKKAAIASFQLKHAAAYGKTLKTAGVDLASLAKEMSAIAPQFKFVADAKTHSITASHRFTASSTVSLPAKPKEQTVRVNAFNTHRNIGCGAIGGGTASFQSDGMRLAGFAIVLGGCTNTANMNAPFNVPKGSSAEFSTPYYAKATAFSVGVIGSASCSADSRAVVALGGNLETIYRINAYAFAPFLWVAFEEEEVSGTFRKACATDKQGLSLDISGTVRPLAAVIVSGTNGELKVDDFDAKVRVQP